MTTPESGNSDYELRIWQELKRYRTVENVSDLPPIYQYWSDRYVAPKLRAIGFDSIDDFFMAPLMRRCADHPDRAVTVVSVGSGNAELEVRLATSLEAAGMTNVTITCLGLNTAMNERAAAAARSAGVNSMLVFEESDFNSWTANQRYDLALASHSLHHVVELEHLFEQIRKALQPDGRCLISDMIGRNGHLRWPEALALVQLVWATTPRRYRYNRQLSRFEERSGPRTERGRCPCLCGTRPLVQSTGRTSLTAVCDVRTHSAFRTHLERDGLVLCSLDRSPYSEGLRWPPMATTGGDD